MCTIVNIDPTDQTEAACTWARAVGLATGHAVAVCPNCGAWAICHDDATLARVWNPADHGRLPTTWQEQVEEHLAG